MTVENFETFIEETRKEFRDLISIYLDGKNKEMKDMIKNKIDKCESKFEVDVLKENLQEEFKLYLDKI